MRVARDQFLPLVPRSMYPCGNATPTEDPLPPAPAPTAPERVPPIYVHVINVLHSVRHTRQVICSLEIAQRIDEGGIGIPEVEAALHHLEHEGLAERVILDRVYWKVTP